jgi:hypothetical protein
MNGIAPAWRGRGLATFLNIAFLVLAAALVIRFVCTGGLAMLRMMGGAPDQMDHDATYHSTH